MRKIKQLIKTGMFYVMMLVVACSVPMTAWADESSSQTPETYTYNADTNRWDSNKWRWDSATNTYVPVTPPQPASPPPAEPAASANEKATAPQTQAAAAGPGSTTTASSDATNSSTENVSSGATVNNNLDSKATTGNATVSKNHTAGNAASGDASGDTTLINTLHSSVQGDNAGIAHFVADIYGNVNGDISLYPAIANAKTNASSSSDSTLNVDNKNKINNDVTISATSGNADVTGNTQAGDAKTGSAHAVANVVNLINSIIAANKSFIGTINIHGNLNGDILISPDFIPQLLASNAGNATSSSTNSLTANLNNNQAIINNIKLAADTGKATVSGNTTAGDAKTGKAQTNLTVLNLTGHQVVAKNSILVFVNVLGKWVGVIANAPVGATAALLGNNVTSNTTTQQTTNVNNDSKITNNIDLSAKSGDASVSNNTKAGDATTGDASASANILNIDTSTFSLSDWFGVVFINVFGTWVGSFGIDTDSGNMAQIQETAKSDPPGPPLQFGFTPHEEPAASSQPSTQVKAKAAPAWQAATYAANPTPTPVEQAQATLAVAKAIEHKAETPQSQPVSAQKTSSNSLPFMVTVGALISIPIITLVAFIVRRSLGAF